MKHNLFSNKSRTLTAGLVTLTLSRGFALSNRSASTSGVYRLAPHSTPTSGNEELQQEIMTWGVSGNIEQESRSKFQALFELAPEAIFLQTLRGCFSECNIAAQTMTGHSKEELLGVSLQDLLSGESDGIHSQILCDLLSTGVFSSEVSLKRKTGRSFLLK
jgi:PAS domain S-box-containing protein